jgi:hypothetical protein
MITFYTILSILYFMLILFLGSKLFTRLSTDYNFFFAYFFVVAGVFIPISIYLDSNVSIVLIQRQ